MSGERKGRPSFELARVYEDGRREVEAIELRNVGGIFTKGARVAMGRRGFLGLSALSTGALLAACDVTQATTTQPAPAPPSTPTATPAPPMGNAPPQGTKVYAGPNFRYKVTYKLPGAARFAVLGRDDGGEWLFIDYTTPSTHHVGWVFAISVSLDPGSSITALPVIPVANPLLTPTPYPTPLPAPPTPTPVISYGGGGYCTCNEICVCIPVAG
jgi:hypothetical protein